MSARLTIVYWLDGDMYVGRLKEVPGVFSQGKTIKELQKNIRGAYHLMMEDEPVEVSHLKAHSMAFSLTQHSRNQNPNF